MVYDILSRVEKMDLKLPQLRHSASLDEAFQLKFREHPISYPDVLSLGSVQIPKLESGFSGENL